MGSIARSLATGVAVAGTISLIAGSAWAQNYRAGSIEVDHPWAVATTGYDLTNSAAYMLLSDHGTEPDQLVSATSPIASKVALHVFNVENGAYGMHPVSEIQISPGTAQTVLEPGGAHVMLEGLKQPLKAGESFPLTLSFKRAGSLRVEVKVEGTSQAVAQAGR
jgi:periplasmic copper chaperone A